MGVRVKSCAWIPHCFLHSVRRKDPTSDTGNRTVDARGEARFRIVIYVKRLRNSPILTNWKRWLGRMGEVVTSSWFRGQVLGLDAKVKLWEPACH